MLNLCRIWTSLSFILSFLIPQPQYNIWFFNFFHISCFLNMQVYPCFGRSKCQYFLTILKFFNYFKFFCLLCVWELAVVLVWKSEGTCRSMFSPSVMWSLRDELQPSGLAVPFLTEPPYQPQSILVFTLNGVRLNCAFNFDILVLIPQKYCNCLQAFRFLDLPDRKQGGELSYPCSVDHRGKYSLSSMLTMDPIVDIITKLESFCSCFF